MSYWHKILDYCISVTIKTFINRKALRRIAVLSLKNAKLFSAIMQGSNKNFATHFF